MALRACREFRADGFCNAQPLHIRIEIETSVPRRNTLPPPSPPPRPDVFKDRFRPSAALRVPRGGDFARAVRDAREIRTRNRSPSPDNPRIFPLFLFLFGPADLRPLSARLRGRVLLLLLLLLLLFQRLSFGSRWNRLIYRSAVISAALPRLPGD